MTLAAMVEISLLQTHRKSVMPAHAGIQCGDGGANTNLESSLRGERRKGKLTSTQQSGLTRLEPKGVQLL